MTALAFASIVQFALQVIGLAYSLLFGFQGLADELGATEFTFNRARVALVQDVLPLLLTTLAISAACSFVIVRRHGWRAVMEERAIARAAILLVPAFVIVGLLSTGVAYLWSR
ncbi:hypothetical protein GCM10022234_01470 [Aeromicrobium panaciterrae]